METQAPNIRSIKPDKGCTLVVTWKGGAETIVDVMDHIESYAVFSPLRTDDAAFRNVAVGEWGWNAHWSNDMEISSETMWRLALQQGSGWLRQ